MLNVRTVSILATVLATTLAGCGGGSNPVTPQPVSTPTPEPVTTLLSEGSRSGLAQRLVLLVPFRTSSLGTIRASVDWTFPATNIVVAISPGRCTVDQINGNTCPFVVVSPPAQTPKPRVVTATGQPAGDYTLYIGNMAGDEESVSWQIFLTATATSASASAARPEAGPPTTVQWLRP
jgi:hypothetical protein